MKKHKAAMATAAVCLTLLTAGCATGPDRKPEDPFEPANRVIFKFNDKLDRTVAQPVARGYQKVTPQPLREAISSFFSNISDLSNLANSVLQLKITEATETLMRIVINSTFGVGGMFDVATVAGLQKHPEDFGLTLGHYGAPAGPYIVLPVFGPSSVRDGIGMGVDVKFNLLNYIEPAARNPLYITQFVSVRSDMLGATDLLKQAALDPYSFVRDAYRQQREARVLGRSGASAPPPDYDGDPGESGGGNAGTPGAAGESPAVPNYSDPGETGGSGTSNGSAPGATGTSPSVPDYSDPGETGGSNGGTQPATGSAAGTGGAGAAAAAGTAGVGAAAATGASGAAGTAGVVATPQPAADKAGAATTPRPATDKTGTATTPQPATGKTGTTTAPQPAMDKTGATTTSQPAANSAGAAESQATPASAAPAAASAPPAASDPAAAPAQPASGTAEPQSSPGPAAH